MDIRLIAFDLDGTFLADDKSIPEENLRALEYAAGKGACIVPATGRIFRGVPDAIKELPFVRYYILGNGAEVYDAAGDRVIHRAELTPEQALSVMDYADALPVLYDCYKDNWGYMTRSMYERAEEYITSPGILWMVKNLRTPVDSLPDYIRRKNEPVQKMQIYVKDSGLKAELTEAYRRRFPELSVTSSLPFNIELNSRHADKGQALCALCEYLGLRTETAMTFGDGTNDSPMLLAAGMGIAMANADSEVKQAADYVTGSNNDAGVAQAIWKFSGENR